MMQLTEVIEGLKEGKSFQRRLTGMDRGYSGTEDLIPRGPGMCTHAVSGNGPNGGWGGAADLPIETLSNGRFDKDGWEPR